MPNLLSRRWSRLAAFFVLYLSEGLPQGFAAVAVALEFKRMGMTAEAIGSFSAIILLPWAWKWIAGPFVDNLYLRRFGHRKQWIIAAQLGMLVTLAMAMVNFPQPVAAADGGREFVGLGLFTTLLIIHNCFAATQDVAIDALACNTLAEHERGLANGLMFGGAQAGAAIGGSGVIFLKGSLGFPLASLLVPLLLLGVLAMTVLLIVESQLPATAPGAAEPAEPPLPPAAALQRSLAEIRSYLTTVLRAFLLTRQGFLGMLLAVVPLGGMALSLTVSTVLSPTLGMSDDEIARLGLVSSLVFVVFCILGGYLSDQFGRRLTLALFGLGTLIPTLWIGWRLQAEGWLHPVEANADGTWPRHDALIAAWWAAGLWFSVFNGLLYGIRTAFFMDIVDPRIAATQFTGYMALLNLNISYSYWWEGLAITPAAKGGWGFTYLQVFLVDAALGSIFLLILPFLKLRHPPAPEQAAAKPGRL